MSIEKIYADVCEEKHRKLTDGELRAWQDVLGEFSDSDIDAALRRHRHNTEVDDFTGKVLGDLMPMPAALKLSIEKFNSVETGKFRSCGKCQEGWIYVYKGLTVGPNPGDPQPIDPKVGAVRRCQCFHEYCARKMHSLPDPPQKRTQRQRTTVLKGMP